jgi:antibiotic biosynthesis monooxygenase (ABM) superfamily enzyme
MSQTKFSLEYIVSVSVALMTAYLMQKGSPNAPAVVKFLLLPLLSAYLILRTMNFLFPHLNEIGNMGQNYFDNRVLGTINAANYVEIFPPILLIFVLTLFVLFKFI